MIGYNLYINFPGEKNLFGASICKKINTKRKIFII